MDGRLEYKYLVPTSLLDDIRNDLRPYVRTDAVEGQQRVGEYTVRSIYYDTPHLNCYETKLDGLKIRSKFRIRGYDRPTDDSVVFLEIKKKCSGFIAKHRAPMLTKHLLPFLADPDPAKYIIQSSGTVRELRDAERFVYNYHRRGLLPTELVVYDREPFMGTFDPSLRITFDKALRGAAFPSPETLYDDHHLEPAMSRAFICEVKFFRCALPGFIRSIISRYQLRRMALSKYTICMDSHSTIPTSSPWRERVCAASSRSLQQVPENPC